MDETRAKEIAGHAIGGHVVRFIEAAIDLGLVALLRDDVLPDARGACSVLGEGAMHRFNMTVSNHVPAKSTGRDVSYNRLVRDLGILFTAKEMADVRH